MTGYRRAYGGSRMPRRHVPWSERVIHLEQSKRKVQVGAKWHEEIFLGINDEAERVVVGTPHGIFFEKHPQSSKRGFWRWHAVQQHQRSSVGAEGGVVNRV